jgi:hypothetical protein
MKMTISTINESQSKAARVVGFTPRFALANANFAEFYILANIIGHDNGKSIFDDEALTRRSAVGFQEQKTPSRMPTGPGPVLGAGQ